MKQSNLAGMLIRSAPFAVLILIVIGSMAVDAAAVGRVDLWLFKLPLLGLALMGLVRRPLYVVAAAALILLAAHLLGEGNRVFWAFYPLWIVGGLMLLLDLVLRVRVRLIGK